MAQYNELSRRGLIKLNHDFDDTNDNALHEFLNGAQEPYEAIRPFEQIAQRVDELSGVLKDKGDTVSQSMMDRVNHVFDGVVKSLVDEVNRCEEIIDEQEDDESYPDENEEDEEE